MKLNSKILSMLVLLTLWVGNHQLCAQTLLNDRFGVSLLLGETISGNYYADAFNMASFIPTLNTETADWVIPDSTKAGSDWYGIWSETVWMDTTTLRGQYPSGDEPFDVEAIYFDNDTANIFITIVTSFPPPPGKHETREQFDAVVPSGDLALDLGLNPAYDDDFHYDYGVNINYEIRQLGNNALPNGDVIGDSLYRTANEDWYLGSPQFATTAGSELSNFDPADASFMGQNIGQVEVDYYLYNMDTLENNWQTYVIEATIPLELLGEPGFGSTVGVSWIPGCRNDGNENQVNIRLVGDLDDISVPVELCSFSATTSQGKIVIEWVTQSETENYGFYIYRSDNKFNDYQKINENIIKGAGNTEVEHQYRFEDDMVVQGKTYYYKLVDVDFKGQLTFHGPISAMVDQIPQEYQLMQNYPNPFNPHTVIRFILAESGYTRLEIFNLLGQSMRVLVDDMMVDGTHLVEWDGKDQEGRQLSSGMYFYKITSGQFTKTCKMVMNK